VRTDVVPGEPEFSFSYACLEGCPASVMKMLLNAESDEELCTSVDGIDAETLSCQTCITGELLSAHCACSTGSLLGSSFSYDFGAGYCTGSGECQNAVLDLYESKDDTGTSRAEIWAFLERWCPGKGFSFSYFSQDYGCIDGCPEEVLKAAQALDQDALCELDPSVLGCQSCVPVELLSAHCACDSEALFASFSYDFTGEGFCQGSGECQDAVVALVASMDETGASFEKLYAGLAEECGGVEEKSFSFSFEYRCIEGCPSAVVEAVKLEDQEMLCALKPAMFECQSCLPAVELAAHCACKSGALFNYDVSYDFTSEGFCQGSGECQDAVVALVASVDKTGASFGSLYEGV
jgi:hypothetical protein